MSHTYRNAWAALILFITLLLLTTGRPAYAAPELTIGNYQLISSKRITRTEFEYTYKAAVTNNTGADVTEVSATVSINSPGITVIDNYLEFGVIPNGAISESNDTFTIRQDRQQTFEPSELIWNFQYEVQAAQPRVSWDIPSLNIEILNGTVEVKPVSFKVDHSIANPGFLVETIGGDLPINLANLIAIQSSKTSALAENEEIQLGLVFNVSADISAGEYWGVLHVLDGEKVIANPLKIRFLVSMGSSDVVPEGIASPTLDRIIQDPDTGGQYIFDEILIGLASDGQVSQLKQIVDENGGIFIGSIDEINLFQARFPAINTDIELDRILADLNLNPSVKYAFRVWSMKNFLTTPDDQYYAEYSPHLGLPWTGDSPAGTTTPLEYVLLPEAWDFTTGDHRIKIAIVDDAFDVDHLDLKGNLGSLRGSNFPFLGQQHGTQVAGVTGAVGNNAIGISGVMWNVTLNLYAVGGIITSVVRFQHVGKVVREMLNAVRDGVNILNLSVGQEKRGIGSFSEEMFRDLLDLQASKNVLFVFAAGNDHHEVKDHVPASLSSSYENVISVAGLGFDGNPWHPINQLIFNNQGTFGKFSGGDVTVAAPSVYLTTFNNDAYGVVSGSSFAAPMVSGLAGLILSMNPSLTPAQLKDIIIAGSCAAPNARKVEGENFYSVNAFESLKLAFNPDAAINACKDKSTPTTKLNDTGITTCSSGSANGLPCPVSGFPGQDGEHGRDALAAAGLLQKVGGGSAGFDFTKLDADGNPLPASATEWSCVKDNHTGLIWEEKTTSGLRSMHHTYTWYNPDSSTNGGDPGVQNGGSCTGSSCDTHGYVQAVNAQGLCGANDWRMPVREDLRGIMDYSRINPAIDTVFFPHTPWSSFWSASPYAGNVSRAWSVHFSHGFDNELFKTGTFHVRLVRGGQ